MRRRAPWVAFVLALACVLGAMGWVTAKLLELERTQAQTEQAAALEDTVRLALWRLDTAVPNHLSTEMAEVALAAEARINRAVAPPVTTPPDWVRGRFVMQTGGGVQWLTPTSTAIDDTLLALVNDQRFAASLQNPFQIDPETVARRNEAFVQTAQSSNYYSQVGQRARGKLEWNKRAQSAVQSLNTVELQLDNSMNIQSGNQQAGSQNQEPGQHPGQHLTPAPTVLRGSFQPLWVGDEFLIVRKIRRGTAVEFQGAWVDWQRFEHLLIAQVEDLLPGATLAPIQSPNPEATERLLATLPARILPGSLTYVDPPQWSPLRASLYVSWAFVLVAAGTVFGLLVWALTLSQRRATFVSTVTHELRTPLTTFRMYTEMLAEGMVEEKRGQYLATLRTEADRLGHLVENVLAFAQIEGKKALPPATSMKVGEVLARVQDRLSERAAQAGLVVDVEVSRELAQASVHVEVTAVEQILFNLVDNAAKYAPSTQDPRIVVRAVQHGRSIEVRVRDFGPGIAAKERRKIFEPFAKAQADEAGAKPGIGLGLALCRRLARSMGGDLTLESADPGSEFVLRLRGRA